MTSLHQNWVENDMTASKLDGEVENDINVPELVFSFSAFDRNVSAKRSGQLRGSLSVMRELVCNKQLWARAVLRQLCRSDSDRESILGQQNW